MNRLQHHGSRSRSRSRSRMALCGCAVWLAWLGLAMPACAAATSGTVFVAPILTPSMPAPRADIAPLIAVARTGQRLVAAGQRGVVMVSDDAGQHWRQVQMPVSSDLTAISFPTKSDGWIVGQDGVVLHSADGGDTWALQSDGKRLPQSMVAYYEHQDATNAAIARSLKDARRMVQDDNYKALLDVWFQDAREGFAVGEFGLIFHTVDAGAHWEPWYDRIDDPKGRHLHQIRRIGGDLFIVGEQGLLLKYEPVSGQFQALQSPYEGSLMGIVGKPGLLVIYGMRGSAFRSRDGGATWQRLDTKTDSLINGGALLDDGRLALAVENGLLLVSNDEGDTFGVRPVARSMSWWGASAAPGGGVALVGAHGVRVASVAKR